MSNQKIVLIGAGSLQFGLGAVGNIIQSEILEGSIICLHDINEENLNLAYQACEAAINDKKIDFTLESTINRGEALKNADYIINSLEVTPRFELWDQDYEIPRKHGNKQIIGENGGPGGLFHSLRVIPPILDVCEDIIKICPEALFINYSNPMSRICLAVKRKFPNLKFVGLCHEFQLSSGIYQKLLNTPLSNLEIIAGGLNHFGVVLKMKYLDTGRDAYPDFRERLVDHFKMIREKKLGDYELIAYIFEKYGYFPYTSDSHYGEYIQWAWEKANIEGVNGFKNGYKTYITNTGKKIKRLILKGKSSRLVKPDGERAIPIIEGVLTDANYMEPSVNLPNDGVILNLPRDLVVECPAMVNKNGISAVKLGEYPKGLAALLRNQASVQDLVVEAVLTNSKSIALQALLADPSIENASQAENILKEMLDMQKNYITLE